MFRSTQNVCLSVDNLFLQHRKRTTCGERRAAVRSVKAIISQRVCWERKKSRCSDNERDGGWRLGREQKKASFVGGGREAVRAKQLASTTPQKSCPRPQAPKILRRSKNMIAAILSANQQPAHGTVGWGGKLLAISPLVNNHGWAFFLV
jgi:hypothetical protein